VKGSSGYRWPAGLRISFGGRQPQALVFFEKKERRFPNSSGMSARVGLGTKAGLAANDRRSEVPLSQAVLGRDGSVLGPDIETFFIFPEPEETGEHHDQAAGADPDLFTDPGHGDAVRVGHDRCRGD